MTSQIASAKRLVFERVLRNSVDCLEVSFPPAAPQTVADTKVQFLNPRFLVTKENFSKDDLVQLRNLATRQQEAQSTIDFIAGIINGPGNTLH